jgi:pimeloyl-ACP methyl ester carboxylesterase
MHRFKATLCSLLVGASLSTGAHAQGDDTTSSTKPVAAIADHTLQVKTARGTGQIPLYFSLDAQTVDMSKPQPGVVRALLIFHGKLRDADVYNQSGLAAIKNAGAASKGTLLITPQFLAQVDVDKYRLPPPTLRWAPDAWMGGDDATNAAVSSFDAIDAILAQLRNKAIFPNLKSVVLAGHSGGGQVVERYAVASRGGDSLIGDGIHVRYLVANPSSYLYFSPDRPIIDAKSAFAYGPPARTCYGKYDKWKYGINDPPPYLAGGNFSELEQRFLRRDVIYLLGTDDTDPNHPALDKTCSGEVQGPYRFFRGKAFFRYLELRHPELAEESATQQLWFVPGVGHEGEKMLNSQCGIAALFSSGTCSTRVLDPAPQL